MSRCFHLLCAVVVVYGVRVTEDSELELGTHVDAEETNSPVSSHHASKAIARCRAVRRSRFFGQMIGINQYVWGLRLAPLSYLLGPHLLQMFVDNPVRFVLQYFTEKFFFFITNSAVASPAILLGAHAQTTWGKAAFARLFGSDGYKPICCCPPGSDGSTCSLVGSRQVGRESQCPQQWEHHAQACAVVEIVTSFRERTVNSCKCKDSEACSTNKFWNGQPWCKVEPGCGKRFRFRLLSRWDYCHIASETVDAPASEEDEENATPQPETIVVNKHLAKFVPNEVRRWGRRKPGNVFRFGSYVDQSQGVVTFRSAKFWTSKCFVGLPAEDLDTCAQRCLEDGAPTADMLSNGLTAGADGCFGFAFNHKTRICVPLPKYARGAEFKPYAKNLNSDGWSNFKVDAQSGDI